MSKKRICVVVLGIFRSGTSALANALHDIGIPMAKYFCGAHTENPKGYYEPRFIQYFSKEISFLLNQSLRNNNVILEPYELHTLRSELIEKIDEQTKNYLINKATNYLKYEYDNLQLFGIKDPNFCTQLPIWHEAFKNLDIEPRFIVTYRNPLEVAYSWHIRFSTPIIIGLIMWIAHMLGAEYNSRGFKRTLIPYDRLLEDPMLHVKQALKNIDVDIKIPENFNLSKAVDKSLKHFNFDLERLNVKIDEITGFGNASQVPVDFTYLPYMAEVWEACAYNNDFKTLEESYNMWMENFKITTTSDAIKMHSYNSFYAPGREATENTLFQFPVDYWYYQRQQQQMQDNNAQNINQEQNIQNDNQQNVTQNNNQDNTN